MMIAHLAQQDELHCEPATRCNHKAGTAQFLGIFHAKYTALVTTATKNCKILVQSSY
jgi:hypothetical protein